MRLGVLLAADIERPQRLVAGLHSIVPGGGIIAAIERHLGRFHIALRLCHRIRRRLIGLHLTCCGERLAGVAHLLHRCASAGVQREQGERRRDDAQDRARAVKFELQKTAVKSREYTVESR